MLYLYLVTLRVLFSFPARAEVNRSQAGITAIYHCLLFTLFCSTAIKASVRVKESSVETGARSRFCHLHVKLGLRLNYKWKAEKKTF